MNTLKLEIENINEQYVEDNLSLLEAHFVANVEEGQRSLDDDIEQNFHNWLEQTNYVEIRNIIFNSKK